MSKRGAAPSSVPAPLRRTICAVTFSCVRSPIGVNSKRRCGYPKPHLAIADNLSGYDPPFGHDVVIDGLAAEPRVAATAELEDVVPSHAQVGLLDDDRQPGRLRRGFACARRDRKWRQRREQRERRRFAARRWCCAPQNYCSCLVPVKSVGASSHGGNTTYAEQTFQIERARAKTAADVRSPFRSRGIASRSTCGPSTSRSRIRFEIGPDVLSDMLGGGNPVDDAENVALCQRKRLRITAACSNALRRSALNEIRLDPRDFD